MANGLLDTERSLDRMLIAVFEHSLFGFLLGSVLAGTGLYYYVVDEYKVSNELLTEDIYVGGHFTTIVRISLM